MALVNPTNINFLSPTGFKFTLNKLPNLQYFVQTVTMPGVTTTSAIQPTPFVKIPRSGDHLEYEPLILTFKLDEDMQTWQEIYDWMTALTFPENFDQYSALNGDITSDATLTLYTSQMNPKFQIIFKDLYPISITELQFDSTVTSIEHIIATATFDYSEYTYVRL